MVVRSSALIGLHDADLAMGENPLGIWLVRNTRGRRRPVGRL